MADAKYLKGAELDDVALTWSSEDSGLYTDLTSGWTFTAYIGDPEVVAVVQKTSGFTPAATAPNLVIAWDAGELDPLDVGVHTCDIEAKHTATGKDRKTSFTIEITAAVLPQP